MSQNSKTAKMVLGQYYRVLNSRLALTRLAILNTWNKNTKTEVASRNNVEHQSQFLTSQKTESAKDHTQKVCQLDYANSLLFGTTQKTSSALQNIQNTLAMHSPAIPLASSLAHCQSKRYIQTFHPNSWSQLTLKFCSSCLSCYVLSYLFNH